VRGSSDEVPRAHIAVTGLLAGMSLEPLADRAIRGMALARFVAVFGNSLLPTALAFGVLDLPGGSAVALGAVMAVASLGQVVVVVPAGVVADRRSRKRVMVIAEAVSGTALVCCGILTLTGRASVVSIAVLAGISGIAAGFFYPASTGFVPEISPPQALQSTNAILKFAANIARIVGVAASGLIVAFLGAGWGIAAAGLMAITAAILVLLLRPRYPAPGSRDHGPFADFVQGWRAFIERRWVVAVVIAGAVSSFGVTAWLGVLGPLRVSETAGAGQWALIGTSMAAGALIGVAVSLRVRPRRPLLVATLALGLLSLPIAAQAVPSPLVVVVIGAFIAGLAVDIFMVLWETTLQQQVPHGVLSRVAAFDWLGSFAMAPLALALAGPMVALVGSTAAMWGAAALAALAPLALLQSGVRTMRSRPQA
jgi:MFS family permease